MYVTVDEIKKHLNIDFNDDNAYLAELIAAAEDYVATYCHCSLVDLCLPVEEPEEGEETDETAEPAEPSVLRPAAKHAIRLLVAHWYNCREAVAFATPSSLPFGLAALLVPLKKFGVCRQDS